ncbi:hypothetical protein A2U01_0015104, partial [Trifolium medium]|nr:hypothetical protein [Trifolium medium]MCH93601.1 hypothetical protein [Trifolium medium]MCH94148.1 hypothetical protein [Trifolium medium]
VAAENVDELHEAEVEHQAEDIDPTRFYEFDVKITDAMATTNQVLCIGDGWYDYKVEKCLKAGDILRCEIEEPPRYMNVKVIRQ